MNAHSETDMLDAREDKKAVLEAARLGDFIRYPKSEEALAVVDHIIGQVYDYEKTNGLRERRRRAKDALAFEGALGSLVAELLLHAPHIESEGYFYRHLNRDALRLTKVSYDHFGQLRAAFVALGYMDCVEGFLQRDKFEAGDTKSIAIYGKASRFRATESLKKLAEAFGINLKEAGRHFPADPKSDFTLVQCRAKSGKKHVVQSGTNQVKLEAARDEMLRLHAIYARHDFAPMDQPRLWRIFNDADDKHFAMNRGGRLYPTSANDWIIDKQLRRKITIDGEATVQIDISSCFITILHGLLRETFDPTKDYYAVKDVPRDVVKRYVTMRLGIGERPKKWARGAAEEFASKYGKSFAKKFPLRSLHDRIEAALPILLKAEKFDLDSVKLQYFESQVIIASLLELGEDHDVAALPIHDCILLPASKLELGMDCVADEFMRMFSVRPKLTVVDYS